MRFQYGRKPSEKLIDEVLSIASKFKPSKSDYIGVGDVLPAVERYKGNIEMVDWMQVENASNFSGFVSPLVCSRLVLHVCLFFRLAWGQWGDVDKNKLKCCLVPLSRVSVYTVFSEQF